MKDRGITDYLQDILENSQDAIEFTKGKIFEEFKSDKKTINAVIRSLEVIGEATRHIPDSFRKEFPNIPWKKIAGMRDKLIHDYTGVDLDTVWKTATKFVPKLLKQIKEIL